MTRVLVGVDAPVVRLGLQVLLADEPSLDAVGWAGSPLELVELVGPTSPDVVLAWFDSLRSSTEVAQAAPELPVLAVAQVRREEDLLDGLTGGLRGLVDRTCTSEQLVGALGEVARGALAFPSGWERTLISRLERMEGSSSRAAPDALALTPRETDVLQLLLDGYSVKQVASRLGIALQTTKNHIHHVMVKTSSASRVELVKWAMRHGFRPSADREPQSDGQVGDAVENHSGGSVADDSSLRRRAGTG